MKSQIDELTFGATTVDGESLELTWQDLIQETIDYESDSVVCRHFTGKPVVLKYSSVKLKAGE